ncbi:hypothetical protein Mtc_1218 [Methanocella conradii HZ254]|uniref:Uncharacterized protein n=1 Tax=Methanocella conradii (strain DSM 24694 / JCM 17849 / CGMCC 1.5162 / HZ254) TaxID=1041930 RepID=H8I8R7_METCZ|nr:hypothetical protein [Methanocella conradii]AFC99971.1 hypothetical protein Mtc_1218 [Methanocella conradii HZ254]MDI6897316.1 hypothetical protein [Methanocella conradii]
MEATILGVQLDDNDACVLKMAFDVRDKKPNYLTASKVKGKEASLEKLIKSGFIVKSIARKTSHYSISEKGIVAYNMLPKEMVSVAGAKKGKGKKDELAELKATVEEMNKKLDRILSLLGGAMPAEERKSMDRADAFEKQLIEEYKKLRAREFLSDGKVWHDQLKRIMMERYQYKDYEYDELLQQLKQEKLGMISLSQGKDKTWIEIRA